MKQWQQFPLPSGCRNVCRPNRNKVRHFNLTSLRRVIWSILDNETAEPEDICKEASDIVKAFAGFSCMKEPCPEVKAAIDEWKEKHGDLMAVWAMWEELADVIRTRNKLTAIWHIAMLLLEIMEAAYETVRFVVYTKKVMDGVRASLDVICKEEDDGDTYTPQEIQESGKGKFRT